MTEDKQAHFPSDAELVAYLDGELSPADSVRIGQSMAADARLKARLDALTKGGRPFAEAFAPLLAQAPGDRLDAMLSDALRRPARASRRFPRSGLYGLVAAAAVVTLVIGAGLDRLDIVRGPTAALFAGSHDEGAEWRRAVAGYLALYTRDTLDLAPAGDRPQELARVGERLGLALAPENVALPDLALKRADLYDYDGKALAFLAYLDPKLGPVALCIIKGEGGAESRRIERRQDMNVVYWSQGSHSFMLIGRAPTERLQALAAGVEARFASGSGSG